MKRRRGTDTHRQGVGRNARAARRRSVLGLIQEARRDIQAVAARARDDDRARAQLGQARQLADDADDALERGDLERAEDLAVDARQRANSALAQTHRFQQDQQMIDLPVIGPVSRTTAMIGGAVIGGALLLGGAGGATGNPHPPIKKTEQSQNFWRVRFRDPSRFDKFRTPDWAQNVAESVVEGAEVTMGFLDRGDGQWLPQTVLIPRERGRTEDRARDLAKQILEVMEDGDGDGDGEGSSESSDMSSSSSSSSRSSLPTPGQFDTWQEFCGEVLKSGGDMKTAGQLWSAAK